MTRWIFMNGTVIEAKTYEEAMEKMNAFDPSKYWAMEEDPGQWTVLFEGGIEVPVSNVTTHREAARVAHSKLLREDVLVGIKPGQPYFERVKDRRCCWWSG